ncbi:hypothetical protein WHR41_06680 [Cladosporium halotolerans]|uniref:Peroxin Pex22-like protein n=1 Tax=Cladosporium halotolerans TaxID=1052096 RepID=A0AB34KLX4_9PEZI
MANDRAQRSRRPLYAPPATGRQQSTLGYWVPLITISTIAIGGLAAWIWSERSDSDEDDRPHHDKPPRPSTGLGGAYPTQGAQPYPGPPPPEGHPPGSQQNVNMPPYEGPVPSQSGGPQGGPPPVGGEAASYYAGRSVHGEQRQQQEASWYGQVRGAIRRTPSPQQFFDSASKQVGAAAAAAGAALGSIMEEDKDAYYEDGSRRRERRGREGEGEVFSDHERWSEEAEEKTRVGTVEAESEKRADAALRSARSDKGRSKSKKTVAVVVSADIGSDGSYDHDSAYQTEHASILSHLPTEHDPSTTDMFVLIYAPTLTSLPPLDYQPPAAATSGLGSSYSQISTPVVTPGSELQSISPRISPSDSSYPKSFDTLYQQALTLVSQSSHILPFTTEGGYIQILKHLAPQLVYVAESLSGFDGDNVAQLRGWVGRTILVAGEGLADTETEDEGTRDRRRWYERSSMVGLGKEVEVVDAARVGEDWGKRVGGRD